MKKAGLFLFTFMICVLFFIIQSKKNIDEREMASPDPSLSEAMKALEFWSAQRAYPEKVIPNEGFYKAFEYSNNSLRKGKLYLNTPDTWTSIGPANRGGRTIALAVDPLNPDIIYAGAASGGLWRLTMNGDAYSWERINTGYPVLGVNGIAIDPTNSDVIYIGTGEVYGYQKSNGGLNIRTTRGSYGIGLLKTTDGGTTWSKKINWSYHQQKGILVIRINPLDSNILFAGTTEGTYKSTDAGETWEKVNSILMAIDIAINPVDTNIVYVSCGNLGSSGHGIYRSMSSGNEGTWTKLNDGLPSTWGGKALLAIYKSSPKIIYASIGNGYETSAGTWLCKSVDHGDTWTIVNTHDYSSYQGWFAHYVRVNPTDDSKVFCAGVYFYVSTDGGSSLVMRSGMHVDHHAYADHPTDPNIVYFGNDGGVYRTLDGGNTYQELNDGYVTTQFYNGFSSSTTNPVLALGGLQDNRTTMYLGTQNWRKGPPLPGGDGGFTAIHTLTDSIMYSSSQWLRIYRSQNGGDSWTTISNFPYGNTVCFIAPFVLSPSHPHILYAGEDMIYKSTNSGDSWSLMNNKNPLNGNPILSIAVSSTHPEIVYAATVPSSSKRAEVFSSTDGGSSWQNITGSLPDRYYVDMQVSPLDDNVVYITCSGFGSSHLYRTVDGGQSWIDIGNGLPDMPTSSVIVDPEDPAHIYVGNDLGVYVSTDYGSTWLEFGESLPTAVLVMDLSISPSNRKIRAITHGNGVYERTLLIPTTGTITDHQSAILAYDLFQNYPNPFNPSTEIKFNIPEPSFVTLIIYSVIGKEIRTMAASGYPKGIYTISWDGKNNTGQPVAAGKYIFRLKAGSYVKSIKMTLIR